MTEANSPATSPASSPYTPETIPSSIKYVLVGGGLASATAAETLRARDPDGSILIVGQEPEYPYNRPPLSKEYLRGEINADGTYGNGGVYVYEPHWYQEHHVTGLATTQVTAIDPAAKAVRLDDGREIHYEKLLLATGGRPRRLTLPGADLPGVFVLRTLADANALRTAIAVPNSRVVVLGSGFIGLEAAAQALFRGGQVTIVDPLPRLWATLVPPTLSRYFESQYTSRGAATHYGYAPTEIRAGEGGRVGSVTIRSVEDQSLEPLELPADIVLMGVGIDLNTELAAAAGLTVDPKQGVVVDDHLRTSAPDIYAAGDLAAYPDPVMGRLHFEHWENAIESAKIAAENMTGGDAVYTHVPYFFSDQFDLSINVLGYTSPTAALAVRGDATMDQFTAFFVTDGQLRGALMVNDDAQMDLLKELIAARVAIADPQKLTDPTFDLASLKTQPAAEGEQQES